MPKRKKTYKYRIRFFASLVAISEILFWLIFWQIMRIFGVFTEHSGVETLTYLKPNYAWFFLLILLLFIVFVIQFRKRNKLVEQLGVPKTLHTFLKPVYTRKSFIRFFLIRNAIVFSVFALMQPVLGTKMVKGQSNNVELIFAVDISNSMNTRDIVGEETRLDVAKRAMNQIVNQSNAARVGLLIFAGSAYPQLPLTADKETVKMYIDEMNTQFISNQGTHISSALQESSEFFSKERNKKVLILITDGEDHEGGMESAYQAIQDKEIETLILGIGTEKGGVVPRSGAPNARSLKDELGRSVISKVNPKMLQEIADELKAEVIVTNESFPNVSQFLTHVNKTSPSKTVDLNFKIKENRYQWPLSISILFVLILFTWELLPKPKKEL